MCSTRVSALVCLVLFAAWTRMADNGMLYGTANRWAAGCSLLGSITVTYVLAHLYDGLDV